MSEPRHFVVYTIDMPDMVAVREAVRPDHIAFMKQFGSRAKVGGPLLDTDGETKIGGMYVLEAGSLEDARESAMQDPYVKAGLFETVRVREWRWQTRNV